MADMSSSPEQPFRTEEVSFPSGELRLAGTLYVPTSAGPHAAVVLVHGSGPQSRDGGGGYLKEVAIAFARRGIAVLAYDKRGVGESEGNWVLADFDDFAGDAVAGLDLLARRPDVDPRRIGFWGFSQGGWIAPLAAVKSGSAAFVVSVSGNSVTPVVQETYRVEAELRADGFAEADVTAALTFQKLVYDVVSSGQGREQLVRAYREIWEPRVSWLDYFVLPYTPDELAAADDQALALARRFLFYDPAPTLERIRGPFLAIFGTLDRMTPFRESAALFERYLGGRSEVDLTIRFFPGANHSLRAARTGGRKEAQVELPYVPGYFETMTEWVVAKTASPRSDRL